MAAKVQSASFISASTSIALTESFSIKKETKKHKSSIKIIRILKRNRVAFKQNVIIRGKGNKACEDYHF